jgi:hypothetical protein
MKWVQACRILAVMKKELGYRLNIKAGVMALDPEATAGYGRFDMRPLIKGALLFSVKKGLCARRI